MTSLYTIQTQYQAQLAALNELDLDPVTFSDTLDGMQGDVQDKLRAVIAWGLDQSVLAAGTKEAAKRVADLCAAREKKAQWAFDYALQAMQATGIGEVSTDEFAAKVAKKPASVNVLDAALIPPSLMRTPEPAPPQPDKASIAAVMKAGGVVPGCELVQGYRLAVR